MIKVGTKFVFSDRRESSFIASARRMISGRVAVVSSISKVISYDGHELRAEVTFIAPTKRHKDYTARFMVDDLNRDIDRGDIKILE